MDEDKIESLESEIEGLNSQKENLKNELQKFRKMSNNAKGVSNMPTGVNDRAKNYDKQSNVNLSLKYNEDANDISDRIKDVDEKINFKRKEIEQYKKIKNENKMADLSKDEILRLLEEPVNIVMSKQELIESINQRILKEDINDDLKRKIERNLHDYSEHLDPELVKNITNSLTDDIKRNVIDKMGGRGDVNLMNVSGLIMSGLSNAMRKEAPHRNELERLAIKLVTEEYNIPEGYVEFDVEITGENPIQKTGLKLKKGSKPLPTNKNIEEVKPEITKRKLMNAMMHGAARKGQNLFHMANEELNNIDPSLVNDYSKLMAGNDMMYWMLDDETINRESESGVHAGQVRVDISGEVPKIIAKGITFPVLLHELTKGVLELLSLNGLPEDAEVREYVLDKTDNLESEPWDIRLGPKLWEKFLDCLEVEDLPFKTDIFNEISRLPSNNFNKLIKGLLEDKEQYKNQVKEIAEKIREELTEYEYESSLSQYSDEESEYEEDDIKDTDDEKDVIDVKSDEEDSDTPENWSKKQLEDAIDMALDEEDYETVKYLTDILNKNF
jgi:hypothetical protein